MSVTRKDLKIPTYKADFRTEIAQNLGLSTTAQVPKHDVSTPFLKRV